MKRAAKTYRVKKQASKRFTAPVSERLPGSMKSRLLHALTLALGKTQIGKTVKKTKQREVRSTLT